MDIPSNPLPAPLSSISTSLLERAAGELHHLLTEFCDGPPKDTLQQKKEWFLGGKQSLLEAIISVKTLELKHFELQHKYKTVEHAPEAVAVLPSEDIEIIDAYVTQAKNAALDDSSASASIHPDQKAGTSPCQSTTEHS